VFHENEGYSLHNILARLFFSFADVLKINGLTEAIDHGMLLAFNKKRSSTCQRAVQEVPPIEKQRFM
jgi:hypothetical protein